MKAQRTIMTPTPKAMTPKEFMDWVTGSLSPAFDTGVATFSIWGGDNGGPFPINPQYCGTVDCANNLALMIAAMAPAVVKADPWFLDPRGPFRFTKQVTFFQFPNGLKENVGQLAQLFTRGGNPDLIFRRLAWTIASDSFTFGFSEIDPGAYPV